MHVILVWIFLQDCLLFSWRFQCPSAKLPETETVRVTETGSERTRGRGAGRSTQAHEREKIKIFKKKFGSNVPLFSKLWERG